MCDLNILSTHRGNPEGHMLLARGMAGLVKISEDNKCVVDISWSEKKKDKQKHNYYIISNCYLLWITSFIVINFTWLFNKTVSYQTFNIVDLVDQSKIPAVPNVLVLPVKFSVYLYSDRKPRACQKLGNSPGVGKYPIPRQSKICKCPIPQDWQGGQCPHNSAGRTCAQLELTDAWSSENFDILDVKNGNPKLIFSLFQCSGSTNLYSGS